MATMYIVNKPKNRLNPLPPVQSLLVVQASGFDALDDFVYEQDSFFVEDVRTFHLSHARVVQRQRRSGRRRRVNLKQNVQKRWKNDAKTKLAQSRTNKKKHAQTDT